MEQKPTKKKKNKTKKNTGNRLYLEKRMKGDVTIKDDIGATEVRTSSSCSDRGSWRDRDRSSLGTMEVMPLRHNLHLRALHFTGACCTSSLADDALTWKSCYYSFLLLFLLLLLLFLSVIDFLLPRCLSVAYLLQRQKFWPRQHYYHPLFSSLSQTSLAPNPRRVLRLGFQSNGFSCN